VRRGLLKKPQRFKHATASDVWHNTELRCDDLPYRKIQKRVHTNSRSLSTCDRDASSFLIVEKGEAMNSQKPLFWGAIIAQVVGAQVFFWDALPDYQQLTAGGDVVGTPRDFVVAVFGLALMQSAYWYARRLQPKIRFRHRVVLGHALLCVSEVSFFFVSALATVAAFDHWKRSHFVLWKAMLLVSAVFAFFCYKRQLASVGDTLLEIKPEQAEKAAIEPKETGKL
jgi:hypothetical protein